MRSFAVCVALAAFAGLAHAQVDRISQLAPSYAPLCTIQKADGSFAPNPSACGTGVDCHMDPYRSGAYYCGAGNAACTVDANCAFSMKGACDKGRCIGGYGTPPIGMSSSGCAASGFPATENGQFTCGAAGSLCGYDSMCATGFCNLKTNHCEYKRTTVGASCVGNPDVCGTIAGSSTKMYCKTSTATCQPIPFIPSQCADGLERIVCDYSKTFCDEKTSRCVPKLAVNASCTSYDQCGGPLGQYSYQCAGMPNGTCQVQTW